MPGQGFCFKKNFFPFDSNANSAEVHFPKSFVIVAPYALAMIAAWSEECHKRNVKVECLVDEEKNLKVLNYAWRMNLMEFMRISYDPGHTKHEPSGRFIPLTKIATSDELESFLINVIPLLHVPPESFNPLRYCFSELIRNVLEHAGPFVPAYACVAHAVNPCYILRKECGE